MYIIVQLFDDGSMLVLNDWVEPDLDKALRICEHYGPVLTEGKVMIIPVHA